jgi:hypothetical protein
MSVDFGAFGRFDDAMGVFGAAGAIQQHKMFGS